MSVTRTRIKICGITNLEDAQAAVAYGADALGFIFVPNTPRYMGQNPGLTTILRSISPFVSPVGVCRDVSSAMLFRGTAIDTVQYYELGETYETVSFQHMAGSKRMVMAVRAKDGSSLDAAAIVIGQFRPHALLLDTYHKDKLGGSGETFNWELAIEAKQRFGLPIILAGGLTAENVGEAVRTVRPYAVDVSSGVEASPGRKDHAKIKAFIEAVRAEERMKDEG